MKTLHFNAVGEYTGYSVNKSSIIETVINVIATAATTLTAGMTFWNVGCQINEIRKASKAAKKISNSNADGFEDPK